MYTTTWYFFLETWGMLVIIYFDCIYSLSVPSSLNVAIMACGEVAFKHFIINEMHCNFYESFSTIIFYDNVL